MPDWSDVSVETVRSLLMALIFDTYRSAGADEGCSYLLCPVSTGPRELELMLKHPEARNGGGLRTKAALKTWLEANGRWETEFVEGVLRPNARDAAGHASKARQTLRGRGVSDLVINPAYIDVRELGLSLTPPVEVDFPRESYLAINSRMYEYVHRVIVCPHAEYGSGMRVPLIAALERGVEVIAPDGATVSVDELGILVGHARAAMTSKGFAAEEVDAYIPRWQS